MASLTEDIGIEVTVDSDEVADILAADDDWKQAQWPAVRYNVTAMGKTPVGDPNYLGYTKVADNTYTFTFRIEVS